MAIAKRIDTLAHSVGNVLHFFNGSRLGEMFNDPKVYNFAVGNPQELPLPAFSDALAQSSKAQNKDWFGYKMSEESSRQIVAETLRHRTGMAFDAADIAMTNGGFAAIALALHTVTNPDDEVIFISPPWFFYEMLIKNVSAVPVRVKVNLQTFDLDLAAIRQAISPKTAAIIVNSPNNPTGKIYSAETLQALADLLLEKSKEYGRDITLLSDEAYNRIVFDGIKYRSPSEFYANTLVLYTYGKTLLTPGQRIGYIAMPPKNPYREDLRDALLVSQFANAWAFPNALLQHALPELEKLSIDIEHLQYKRDWMVQELSAMGYELHSPEGTFYLLPKSPLADDWAFAELLAEQNVLCLPGRVVEMDGFFRLSLTASDSMIENSLAGFEAALKAARA